MGSLEKTKRNEKIFLLWVSNPKKWSFTKLGEKFGIGKFTAYDIVVRERTRRGVDKVPTKAIDKSPR